MMINSTRGNNNRDVASGTTTTITTTVAAVASATTASGILELFNTKLGTTSYSGNAQHSCVLTSNDMKLDSLSTSANAKHSSVSNLEVTAYKEDIISEGDIFQNSSTKSSTGGTTTITTTPAAASTTTTVKFVLDETNVIVVHNGDDKFYKDEDTTNNIDDTVLEEDVEADDDSVDKENEKLLDLKLTCSHRYPNHRSDVNKMSIDDRFAVSDEPALLKAVKSTDVIASDLAAIIHVLAAKAKLKNNVALDLETEGEFQDTTLTTRGGYLPTIGVRTPEPRSNQRSDTNNMSINNQFADLSLSGKPSLLEALKTIDVIASDLVADTRDDDDKAVSLLPLIKALTDFAPDAKAATRLYLAACLSNAVNRNKTVVTVATDVALAPVCTTSNPFVMASLLPVFFNTNSQFIIFDPGINTTQLERRQPTFLRVMLFAATKRITVVLCITVDTSLSFDTSTFDTIDAKSSSVSKLNNAKLDSSSYLANAKLDDT